MGLLDSILGNMMGQGGPAPQPRGGSTSPMVKALMLLLAAKAYQHYTANRQANPQGAQPGGGGPLGDLAGSLGRGQGQTAGPGGGPSAGGLGGMLPGGLGGILGGLIGGGGLGAIVDQFRRNGFGDQVDSWVGRGQNKAIAPDQLAQALGPDTIDQLGRETGLPRDEVLSELSQELPEAVDQFTPEGRMPTQEEVSSRWV